MKNNIKQGRHAELVSASSAHTVLKDKLQAWKISNQVHNDTTNFTSGLHPTYNNTNAWGRSDVSPTIASVRQRGFTLIELLVVVLIIGILAAVALPQYNKAVKKSRLISAIPTLRAISHAKEMYKIAHGSYTADLDALDIDLPYTSKTGTPDTQMAYTGIPFKGHLTLSSTGPAVIWYSPYGFTIEVYNTTAYCHSDDICALIGTLNYTTEGGVKVYKIKEN